MIHVIASIEVKPDSKTKFIDLFKQNIPNVQAEDGCIRYELTEDAASGIPVQIGPRGNVVTVVEAWDSLEALFAHLKAPHMAAYKSATEGMVNGVSLQVLKPV